MSPIRNTRPVGARHIRVIDGLFDPAFIATLAGWVEGITYGRSDFDTPGTEEFRHFKREISPNQLDTHPLCRQLAASVCSEIENAYASYFPKLTRAYVNLVVHGDHHTAHIDNVRGVTAIYYPNVEWRDDWRGETLFYSDGEAVAAVAPRPGRLALLPADVMHRIGGLSPLCSAARYTVAFKFETTETVR